MKKIMILMGLMMLLVVGMASAEMVDDFTGSLGALTTGDTNEQGYSYLVETSGSGSAEIIADDIIYLSGDQVEVTADIDYQDGDLVEILMRTDAGATYLWLKQPGVGENPDLTVGFQYDHDGGGQAFSYNDVVSTDYIDLKPFPINTSHYYLVGFRFNYTNSSVDCYLDGEYKGTLNAPITNISQYVFRQWAGISLYVDWISTEGSRPCVANWTCSDYAECVSPATNVSCTNVTDVNSCGDSYTGNLSEFVVQSCTYPVASSSSSSSGTRYLVDADGNIVGVSQNGGVVQSLVPEKEAPFLSIGGGSSFDVKAWFSDLWATISGWFKK